MTGLKLRKRDPEDLETVHLWSCPSLELHETQVCGVLSPLFHSEPCLQQGFGSYVVQTSSLNHSDPYSKDIQRHHFKTEQHLIGQFNSQQLLILKFLFLGLKMKEVFKNQYCFQFRISFFSVLEDDTEQYFDVNYQVI